MDKSLPLDLAPDDDQMLKMIERCLTAIRESNERGVQAEAEIAELQAETPALLAELRTTLDMEATR